MSDETAVVEQSSAPSLAEAYEAGQNNLAYEAGQNNLERGERTDPLPKRISKLSEQKDTQRELNETYQQAEHAKPRREPTLQEALDGVQPEAAQEFTLPSEFASYDAADIEACLGLMGLSESDMQRPELAALVLKELESSFPQNTENDDPEMEAEESEDEAEEEKPQDKKKPVDPNADPRLTEIPIEALHKHADEVWTRAEQINHPQAVKLFTDGLAKVLDTPPENRKMLEDTVSVLQWGAQSIIESAVPALVHSYMEANFANVMEGYAPGFQQNYTSDMLNRTWDSVRGNDLPKFGTPEFHELAKEVHEKHPFLNDIDFKDRNGKPLPVMDALRAKAELTARLCRGERVTPQTIQDAVARGRADASRSNRRVSASGAMGRAGRTTGSIGKHERGETSLRDAYNAEHGKDGGIA